MVYSGDSQLTDVHACLYSTRLELATAIALAAEACTLLKGLSLQSRCGDEGDEGSNGGDGAEELHRE